MDIMTNEKREAIVLAGNIVNTIFKTDFLFIGNDNIDLFTSELEHYASELDDREPETEKMKKLIRLFIELAKFNLK